ncbi:MAG: dephospho-CoA kinase [Gemmatimonadota bacterium]
MHLAFNELTTLLIRLGPWLVLAMTLTETALFIGLLLPAEATVLLAAFLAEEGVFSLEEIAVATVAGAFIGDQIGYVLGRTNRLYIGRRSRRASALRIQYQSVVTDLFRRHSAAAVTVGRFISFVRTLMPWVAGVTRIPYRRFVFYDLLGVLGWSTASVALGFLVGESWHLVAGWFGTVSAAILVLLVVGGWLLVRRVRRQRRTEQENTPGQSGLRVGLTGNIASGKSAVADVWARLGAVIIDADVLARRAVEPGTVALARIADRFGPDILRPDGRLDRDALRRRVFADEAARRDLEDILHPEIARLRADEEAAARAAGADVVVNVVPLLFEVGLDEAMDVVVLVDAPVAVRTDRLVQDRGLAPEEARGMIEAQEPAAAKRARAHIVIDNDGTLEELERKAKEAWESLKARTPSA